MLQHATDRNNPVPRLPPDALNTPHKVLPELLNPLSPRKPPSHPHNRNRLHNPNHNPRTNRTRNAVLHDARTISGLNHRLNDIARHRIRPLAVLRSRLILDRSTLTSIQRAISRTRLGTHLLQLVRTGRDHRTSLTRLNIQRPVMRRVIAHNLISTHITASADLANYSVRKDFIDTHFVRTSFISTALVRTTRAGIYLAIHVVSTRPARTYRTLNIRRRRQPCVCQSARA